MILLFLLILWFGVLREGFGSHFGVFWRPWAHFFWLLQVLKTGLKFDDFCRDPLGGPVLRSYTQMRVTCDFRVPETLQNQRYQPSVCRLLESDWQTADWKLQTGRLVDWKDTKTAAASIGWRKRRQQLQTYPSQPDGPLKGAGGYIVCIYIYIYIWCFRGVLGGAIWIEQNSHFG